jgi:hypothetical protein
MLLGMSGRWNGEWFWRWDDVGDDLLFLFSSFLFFFPVFLLLLSRLMSLRLINRIFGDGSLL